METIKVTGLNPDADLFEEYLEELNQGITDLDYDDWKEEILADDWTDQELKDWSDHFDEIIEKDFN